MTRVLVVVDENVAGSIALSDTIHPESYAAIRALQKCGIKSWMLIGDGVGDSPALAQAQVGVAVGSGTDGEQ